MTDLKPCPFCGGAARLVRDSYQSIDMFQVRCEDRLCVRTSWSSQKTVIAVWNRRVR